MLQHWSGGARKKEERRRERRRKRKREKKGRGKKRKGERKITYREDEKKPNTGTASAHATTMYWATIPQGGIAHTIMIHHKSQFSWPDYGSAHLHSLQNSMCMFLYWQVLLSYGCPHYRGSTVCINTFYMYNINASMFNCLPFMKHWAEQRSKVRKSWPHILPEGIDLTQAGLHVQWVSRLSSVTE